MIIKETNQIGTLDASVQHWNSWCLHMFYICVYHQQMLTHRNFNRWSQKKREPQRVFLSWEIYFQLDFCVLLQKVRRLWDQIKPYRTILCMYIYIHQMNFILYIYRGFCQVVYIPGSCQVVQYIHANGSGFYTTSPPVNMEFARNPCS